MRRVRDLRWGLVELWGDIAPGGRYSWSPKPQRRMAVRRFMCGQGLHWPISWSESAYPGSWDPPEPPEPGWSCEMCGQTFIYGNYRLRFRAWITPVWWIEWRLKRWEKRDAR